ncbi:putative transporter [Porphyromonas loveana]|uniref:AspT/YidE/YbjL antiporter-like protein n=3 Tax=Porphyromonas loveana TaxID=1884669 RepID=A0A2U1FAD7_9PORP|nr:putative transporter [Porphyromonas loveana]PVZ09153.1 AspT/YidE/YbjL antiporter-like protein [Porphyromonas loveana]
MDAIAHWLHEVFLEPSVTQTIIILSFVSAVGLLLGKVRIGSISLGITFVFFVGILASHFGIETDPVMLSFAQNFGLVVFVYALGLQVGPAFFPSLKKGGIAQNLISLGMVAITFLLCIILYFVLGISMPNLMGIVAGATTNTPALGAAQTTLQQIDPSAANEMTQMALACAVTYPMGVVGVIIALAMLKVFMHKKEEQEEKEAPKTFFSEYEVCNPALDGKTVRDVAHLIQRPFIITRVWHRGTVEIPTSDMILHLGDHVLAVSGEEDTTQLEILFGKREEKDWNRPDIDWNSVDKQLVSRRLVITRSKLNGVRLGNLKIRNLYGVNISRVDRAGVELLPDRDLHLQLGDRLTVVGEGNAVERVAEILGDEVKQLDNPHLTTLFGGLFLGCIFGLIPFYLPGVSMPIKLGLAGGPIIVGILMGAFGPRFHLTTYVTNSANLFLRQLGIILYLGGLGLASGANFFDTIIHGDGFLWVGVGFLITMLPTLLIGWISIKVLRNRYDGTAGMICGSTANPMALDYVNGQVKGDGASVVYATVYPLAMFVRIIMAQIMILVFR